MLMLSKILQKSDSKLLSEKMCGIISIFRITFYKYIEIHTLIYVPFSFPLVLSRGGRFLDDLWLLDPNLTFMLERIKSSPAV